MTPPAFASDLRHTLTDVRGNVWVQVHGKLYADKAKTTVRHVEEIRRVRRRRELASVAFGSFRT